MAKAIYKYELVITDRQVISIPEGSSILTVQMQNGRPCMWVLVEVDREPVDRIITCYGTGNPIKSHPGAYIGTVQSNGGSLVWHFFNVMGD